MLQYRNQKNSELNKALLLCRVCHLNEESRGATYGNLVPIFFPTDTVRAACSVHEFIHFELISHQLGRSCSLISLKHTKGKEARRCVSDDQAARRGPLQ